MREREVLSSNLTINKTYKFGYSHSDPPIQLLQPFLSTSYYF
jgi:hypothetical protein